MNKVLVVDNNSMFSSLLRKKIKSELKFDVQVLDSYEETAKVLKTDKSDFFIAVVDLSLPDAPDGQIVDLVQAENIPCIVLTSQVLDEIQDMIWSKMVVDYVLKGSTYAINYTLTLIRRIYRNNAIKVLIADDSAVFRKYISELLKVHQYHVFEACDGKEALGVLDSHPDIKLVIVDFNMPNMDGFQLTKKIRRMYSKDELGIIGVSVWGSSTLSAHFIKYGANDFINKPIHAEEFYCRISQNIEMLENVEALRESLNEDYLTHLANRRMFFDTGRKLHANAIRSEFPLAVGMIDIDHFKRINDTYGHATGDEVLRQFGELLKKRFRSSDIVARFGGEEFCVLVSNIDPSYTLKLFEEIRMRVEAFNFTIGVNTIKMTISVGVCNTPLDSLEDMINIADDHLYKAKNSGRNKVVLQKC